MREECVSSHPSQSLCQEPPSPAFSLARILLQVPGCECHRRGSGEHETLPSADSLTQLGCQHLPVLMGTQRNLPRGNLCIPSMASHVPLLISQSGRQAHPGPGHTVPMVPFYLRTGLLMPVFFQQHALSPGWL